MSIAQKTYLPQTPRGILIGEAPTVKGFKTLLLGQKLQTFIQILEIKRLQNCNKLIFRDKNVKKCK